MPQVTIKMFYEDKTRNYLATLQSQHEMYVKVDNIRNNETP